MLSVGRLFLSIVDIIPKEYYIHLMYGTKSGYKGLFSVCKNKVNVVVVVVVMVLRESFVLLRVLMFPETKSMETSGQDYYLLYRWLRERTR